MKIVTPRDQIRRVAAAWKETYGPIHVRSAHTNAIYAKLLALNPETATAEEVNAIIGYDSWTDLGECFECGKPIGPVGVLVGDGRDHEYGGSMLCVSCVATAEKLLEEYWDAQ